MQIDLYRPYILLLGVLWSFQALSWGPRGHEIIARVSTRLALESKDIKYFYPFYRSSTTVEHYSNVPDTVWKSWKYSEKKVRDADHRTHFMGIDRVFSEIEFSKVPRKYRDFKNYARSVGVSDFEKVGTAPWRAKQFYDLMKDALKDASEIDPKKSEYKEKVEDALQYAGLLAHYVGDLANPHHATGDYDGWGTNQGGLHSFFETTCVATFPLMLDHEVQMYSQTNDLFKNRIAAQFESGKRSRYSKDPLAILFALTIDSANRLPQLLKIDKEHVVIEESTYVKIDGKSRGVRARRKSSFEAAEHFKDLIVERMAVGATVLEHLWRLAWEEAEGPDLSHFRGELFVPKPKFVYPNYL